MYISQGIVGFILGVITTIVVLVIIGLKFDEK